MVAVASARGIPPLASTSSFASSASRRPARASSRPRARPAAPPRVRRRRVSERRLLRHRQAAGDPLRRSLQPVQRRGQLRAGHGSPGEAQVCRAAVHRGQGAAPSRGAGSRRHKLHRPRRGGCRVRQIGRGAQDSHVLLGESPVPVRGDARTGRSGFIRDAFYDAVADNRYELLGIKDECRLGDDRFDDRFVQ